MAVLAQIVKVFRDYNGPFSARFRNDANGYVAPEHHIAGDDGSPVLGAATDAAWDGSASSTSLISILKAAASKLLGTVAVSAQSLPLPSGAATEAKQDALASANHTDLSAIANKLTSDPATATLQGTANTTLATLLSVLRGKDTAGNDLPVNFSALSQHIVTTGTTTTVTVTDGTNTWVQTITGAGTNDQTVSGWVKQ